MKRLFPIVIGSFTIIIPLVTLAALNIPGTRANLMNDRGGASYSGFSSPAPVSTAGSQAVSSGSSQDFAGIVNIVIKSILNPLVGLLLVLSTVYFIWGMVKYIQAAGDEKERSEAKNHIIYGLIGLFVIVSMWGLVNLLSNTFLLSNTVPRLPSF